MIDPEKLLTSMVADVADIGRRVTTLEQQELMQQVAQLRTAIAGIRDAVDALEPQTDEAETERPPSPNWVGLDQDQARELWTWLVDWTGSVLHPMYLMPIWRPCWYEHPRLRVELTWLCAYWHWSYDQHAPPSRAAEWHARWLPYVETLMRRELRRCGYPTEESDPTRDHLVPRDRDQTDFVDSVTSLDEYIDAHVARLPPPKGDD